MGWIADSLDFLHSIGQSSKKWMNMPDNMAILADATRDCKMDIKGLASNLDTVSGVVKRIEKFGSEGAVRAIKEVGASVTKLDEKLQSREGKLYDRIKELDDKLDTASLDLARLEGVVQVVIDNKKQGG